MYTSDKLYRRWRIASPTELFPLITPKKRRWECDVVQRPFVFRLLCRAGIMSVSTAWLTEISSRTHGGEKLSVSVRAKWYEHLFLVFFHSFDAWIELPRLQQKDLRFFRVRALLARIVFEPFSHSFARRLGAPTLRATNFS
mmetsp:Transcript_9693/g.23477  ORF Transcript_9693/g.23477 Transcript_9693/m.23477 type:complete len:141 (+) Transcript_9693:318-740(+)